MSPVLEVGRGIFRQNACISLLGADNHMPGISVLPHTGVTEVGTAVTVIRTSEAEDGVLGPSLEIRRGSVHHHLAVIRSFREREVSGIEDIIEFVRFVIDHAAGT